MTPMSPGNNLAQPFAAILHEKAFAHFAENCPGVLSIKCMQNGRALYHTSEGRYTVGPQDYLILNSGQPYTIEIDSRTQVESFCVFFEDTVASEVLHTLSTPADRLLDEPWRGSTQSVTFFEKTYAHDACVSPLLRTMHQDQIAGTDTPDSVTEQSLALLAQMLQVHRQIGHDAERIPAVRPATRYELYRRLHLARDFMEAGLGEPITLAQIAQTACLSPSHFLRLFRETFGETPHQYLIRRRLIRAQQLLEETEMPVGEICWEVGFESVGSFGTLFRRRFGVPPTEYRKTAILKKTPQAFLF